MHQPATSRGFTLLEMIIVVAIIAMLATLITANVVGEQGKAQVAKAKADIQTLETALAMYKLDNFVYPSTEQGLRSLLQKPAGSPEARNWRQGGYIKRLPNDPWDRPYQYLSPGQHGTVDVYSFGADGQSGGEGENADIGNWDPGGN